MFQKWEFARATNSSSFLITLKVNKRNQKRNQPEPQSRDAAHCECRCVSSSYSFRYQKKNVNQSKTRTDGKVDWEENFIRKKKWNRRLIKLSNYDHRYCLFVAQRPLPLTTLEGKASKKNSWGRRNFNKKVLCSSFILSRFTTPHTKRLFFAINLHTKKMWERRKIRKNWNKIQRNIKFGIVTWSSCSLCRQSRHPGRTRRPVSRRHTKIEGNIPSLEMLRCIAMFIFGLT